MSQRGPVVHRHHLLALYQVRVADADRRVGQVNLRLRVPLLGVFLDDVDLPLPTTPSTGSVTPATNLTPCIDPLQP